MGSRVAYFDCYSGASGDMVLGALVDAGLDPDLLRAEVARLPISGYRLEAEKAVCSGLAGTRVRVEAQEGPERRLRDIEALIQSSTLTERVRERAVGIFRGLAAAEAEVHGTAIEQVHFHEVGAADAIVDIVGAAIGLERLSIDRVYASSLPMGHGSVQTLHGTIPLPAPATLALIAQAKVPTRPVDVEAELVTPTGAAILVSVAEFRQPAMVVERVGVGIGARELPWPNVLRLWIGEALDSSLGADQVTVIETNLDDCPPEQAAFAMERLLEAGALDVFFTAAQMKKNRPGLVLTVLAQPAQAHELARIVLRETPSLGVRFRASERLTTPRRSGTVETRYGEMRVKIKTIDGRDVVCAEYEECARVARERAVPIGEVYAAVQAGRVVRREL